MRKILSLAACLLLFATVSVYAREKHVVTLQAFYNDLAPYGTWIDYPEYGHVWHPDIEGEFRPYATNGHWEHTDEGWLWVSGYEWGWAPFHYGSWLYDDKLGWLWMPGDEWASAWVTWGSVDGYYAWAPISPEVFIEFDYDTWRPHSYYWNMVEKARVYDSDLSAALLPPTQVRELAGSIAIIDNFEQDGRKGPHYAAGPEVSEVGRYVSKPITSYHIEDTDKLHNNQLAGEDLSLYRPAVTNTPQPVSYRKASSDDIRPIRSNDEWPNTEQRNQIHNVDLMPLYQPNIPVRISLSNPRPSLKERRADTSL